MKHWSKELKQHHRSVITKLTDANCQRTPEQLAKDYADYALSKGLPAIHVFPSGKTDRAASSIVNKYLYLPYFQQVTIDPADYMRASK